MIPNPNTTKEELEDSLKRIKHFYNGGFRDYSYQGDSPYSGEYNHVVMLPCDRKRAGDMIRKLEKWIGEM